MQRDKTRMSQRKALTLLILGLAVIGALIWGATQLFGDAPSSSVSMARLPCPYSDTITPFGSRVLYYDGSNIQCINDNGTSRWSFRIGENANFSCNDQTIVAWVGNTIYLLDENGNASYNDKLEGTIQFARVGKQYVTAIIGDTTNPSLVIKDHMGGHMDREMDAYKNLIILDVGFFGANDEFMWALALDVFGTAANTVLNTFEVGHMNTGAVSLGASITYKVLYDNGVLRVINTRTMRSFNDRGTEDMAASMLVYGLRLLDYEIPARGDAFMLYAPNTQTSSTYDIRELHVFTGTSDRRYGLSDSCIGALIWNRTIYAVSAKHLLCVGRNDTSLTSYDLPMDSDATHVLGKLTNGKAIVACGNDVYVITLPQAVGVTN